MYTHIVMHRSTFNICNQSGADLKYTKNILMNMNTIKIIHYY